MKNFLGDNPNINHETFINRFLLDRKAKADANEKLSENSIKPYNLFLYSLTEYKKFRDHLKEQEANRQNSSKNMHSKSGSNYIDSCFYQTFSDNPNQNTHFIQMNESGSNYMNQSNTGSIREDNNHNNSIQSNSEYYNKYNSNNSSKQYYMNDQQNFQKKSYNNINMKFPEEKYHNQMQSMNKNTTNDNSQKVNFSEFMKSRAEEDEDVYEEKSFEKNIFVEDSYAQDESKF